MSLSGSARELVVAGVDVRVSSVSRGIDNLNAVFSEKSESCRGPG